MNTHLLLSTAMNKVLESNGICRVESSGEFVVQPGVRSTIFPGAVYGFGICLTEKERLDLFAEAKARNLLRLTDIKKFIPIVGELYPLYWGKDKQLGARPHQHLHNPTKTGAIRLSTYETLRGKTLACSTIVVNDYVKAERVIQSAYPDLLKTTTKRHEA